MKKTQRKRKRKGWKEWSLQTSLTLGVTRGDRQLQVLLGPIPDDKWYVLAIEAPRERLSDTLEQTAARVLENHAHAPLGQHHLDQAMDVAERYAMAWARGDAKALERCRCEAIAVDSTIQG